MKRKMMAVLMSVLCAMAAVPSVTVFADGQRVVTLGADLSDDQKQAILRYFGVAGQNLQTLTITNQDERNHLGSYVPLEQIGSHTYSCAYVNPTNSGGIQVKTANLSWVTSNMIATTLSTSGVVNCEVLAASPFEVSGTGALTGILMAYESAVGTQLDETKKDIATQEMITTTTIANSIGQQLATEIVNDSKMQVIQGNDVTQNDIDIIINNVAEEKNISLTDEDRNLLNNLLDEISQQDYDYDDMKTTLERVEQNVDSTSADLNAAEIPSDDTGEADDVQQVENETDLSSDSILMNTDDSALGSGVTFDATDQAALTEETNAETSDDETQNGLDFEITASDSYTDENSDTNEESTESQTNAANDDTTESETAAGDDGIVTSNLEVISMDDFVFAPATSEKNGYAAVSAGINMLTISFPREDLIAGSGSVTVSNSADGTSQTIAMNDSSKVTVEPMTESELSKLGWTSGYQAKVLLDEVLAADAQYYVTLSQDAFETQDGIGTTEATDGTGWQIQTSAYGFNLNQPIEGVKAGDTVYGQMLLGGSEAVYAVIENADDAQVTFEQTEFSEDGSIAVTFWQTGETTVSVSFYDADGTLLNTYSCDVTVE
ncbi:MAG: DUF1002 domain-containing protein [Lachnospiraceae bacterium]